MCLWKCKGLLCPVESQLCLEASLHSLTLHSSLVHAGLCVSERERDSDNVCRVFLPILCHLLTQLSCGIITEIILRKIVKQTKRRKRFVLPVKVRAGAVLYGLSVSLHLQEPLAVVAAVIVELVLRLKKTCK